MTHDFSEVFETDNELWQRVLEIFEANEKFPKKIVSNRNLHHKFPRSFSKKLGEEVDNDKDNLVSLSLSDHFLVHYYYYKLAKKGFRQSMATAFTFMAKKSIKYMTPETAESIAKDYDEALNISNKHNEVWNKNVAESLKGKHLTEEHKKHISLGLNKFHEYNPNHTNPGNSNMHWYNNGEVNICAFECPEGFVEGKLFNKSKVKSEFGEIFENYYGLHRSDNNKLYMREYVYYKKHGKLKGK